MATEGIKPSSIALVVCDNVYQEESGKVALVGLFNNISAERFPARHPRMAVFVSVTDVRKGMIGRLDIVHGETDNPILEARGPLGEGVSPTDVVDMTFILRNVVFPEPGTYFIRFFGNDHPLMMRPFHVIQSESRGKKHDEDTE